MNKFKNNSKYISSNKIKLIPKHRNASREKEVETYGAAWHQGRKENENVKEARDLFGGRDQKEKARGRYLWGGVSSKPRERKCGLNLGVRFFLGSDKCYKIR